MHSLNCSVGDMFFVAETVAFIQPHPKNMDIIRFKHGSIVLLIDHQRKTGKFKLLYNSQIFTMSRLDFVWFLGSDCLVTII